MPGFKTPKAVVFGPIPKTSTGKIQKFLLRDQVHSAKAISGVSDPEQELIVQQKSPHPSPPPQAGEGVLQHPIARAPNDVSSRGCLASPRHCERRSQSRSNKPSTDYRARSSGVRRRGWGRRAPRNDGERLPLTNLPAAASSAGFQRQPHAVIGRDHVRRQALPQHLVVEVRMHVGDHGATRLEAVDP